MQHIYMHISSPLLVLRNLGFVEPQAQLRSRRHGQISQGDEAEGEIGLTATKTQWLISLSLSMVELTAEKHHSEQMYCTCTGKKHLFLSCCTYI